MKKCISQFVTAFLAIIAVGFAEEGCYQDCGWECRYPSAYSFNCFQGICNDIRLSGSLLYWQLSDEPYEFLIEKKSLRNTAVEATNVLLSSKERTHGVGFGYDPGFRVGLGTTIPCIGQCLDLDFFWTHYYVHGKKHEVLSGLPDPIFNSFKLISAPEVSGSLAAGQSADFQGKAKFRYDVLDLEVGKWCCLCEGLRFRPFFGLRYADIEDHTKVDFAFTGTIQGTSFLAGSIKTSNSFRGLGVRGGFGIDYDCFCGLNLYANIAGSFAWGKAHHAFGSDTILGEDNPVTRTLSGGDNGRAFLDGSIGLQYSTCLCGSYPVLLDLAWEQNYLFNMHRNQIVTGLQTLNETSNGFYDAEDLILSGLTFTVELEF